MTLYAAIDPAAPEPSRVLGFYDTEALDYPNLPEHLVELTPEQWAVRLENTFFAAGKFVPQPPLTASQVTAAALAKLSFELAVRQAAGVAFQLASGASVIVGTNPASVSMNSQAGATGLLLTLDGTPVPVTPAEAAGAQAAAQAYLQAVMRRYAALHAAVIADATTDIHAGWPASGG